MKQCPYCKEWVESRLLHYPDCTERPASLAGRHAVSAPVNYEVDLMDPQQDLGVRIAKKAREYIDTPYFHCGRQKGLGVDCIGLLFCVAHDLGITDYDETNYQASMIDPVHIEEGIARFCDPVDPEEIRTGDICIMNVQGSPQHTGIYTHDRLGEPTFIHAHQSVGRVVENVFDRFWKKQLHRVYRVRLNG